MTATLPSVIRLPLARSVLDDTVSKARAWAAVKGLVLRTAEPDPTYRLELAPFVLLPSPFPRHEYDRVKQVQSSLNAVIHRTAHDNGFLTETLRSAVEADDFTARLFRINETVIAEGRRQPLSLGIFRFDYMLDGSKGAKQVEMNTISSSFASLATEMTDLHRYVLTELGCRDLVSSVPDNRPIKGFAKAFVAAWEAFNCKNAVIVFLVEPFVRMVGDQKLIECEILKRRPDIRVLHRTMADFVARGQVLDDGTLIIDDCPVAVVYYRDGYTPAPHIDEDYWTWRLAIERSTSIKCPSIQYQLAGLKKVQQRLANADVLRSMLEEPADFERITNVFTGLYSLDEAAEYEAIEAAVHEHPERFVLKPQREGGGNNVYGEEASRLLRSLESMPSERSAYILMDRIVPPTTLNYLLRPTTPSSSQTESSAELAEVVSELGIYGVILGSEREVLLNEEVGHLLRTKSATVNEGGVVAGFACLDAMLLV